MSDIATAVAVGIVLAAQLGMVAVIMPIVVRELRAIRGALSYSPEKPAKTAEKSRHSVITSYVNDRRISKRRACLKKYSPGESRSRMIYS